MRKRFRVDGVPSVNLYGLYLFYTGFSDCSDDKDPPEVAQEIKAELIRRGEWRGPQDTSDTHCLSCGQELPDE